jgi:hypothetical protein
MTEFKVEASDVASYVKFLTENPPDNPFSLLSFLEAYRNTFDCDFDLFLVTRNGTPVASCALFVRKRLTLPMVRLMPIRTYDGVNFRKLDHSNIQKQEYDKLLALQALEKELEKKFSFHQLVFPPGFVDMRAFQWSSANVIPQYTYILDLQSLSEGNYTKSLREVLRSAEQAHFTFGPCEPEDLSGLQQLSYERHGRKAPVSGKIVSKLLKELNSGGLLDINCVRSAEGVLLAGLARLRAERGSYFFVAGTNAKSGKGAAHLLYHEVLMADKNAGKSFADFCGANTPTINLFKSAFGPRLQIYFRVWRANGFVTRLASLVKKI